MSTKDYWICSVCGDEVSRTDKHLRVRVAVGWDHTSCHTESVQLSPVGSVEQRPKASGRPGYCLGLDGKWRPNSARDTTDRDARIVVLRGNGLSLRQIARDTDCSVGTVHRVLQRWESQP